MHIINKFIIDSASSMDCGYTACASGKSCTITSHAKCEFKQSYTETSIGSMVTKSTHEFFFSKFNIKELRYQSGMFVLNIDTWESTSGSVAETFSIAGDSSGDKSLEISTTEKLAKLTFPQGQNEVKVTFKLKADTLVIGSPEFAVKQFSQTCIVMHPRANGLSVTGKDSVITIKWNDESGLSSCGLTHTYGVTVKYDNEQKTFNTSTTEVRWEKNLSAELDITIYSVFTGQNPASDWKQLLHDKQTVCTPAESKISSITCMNCREVSQGDTTFSVAYQTPTIFKISAYGGVSCAKPAPYLRADFQDAYYVTEERKSEYEIEFPFTFDQDTLEAQDMKSAPLTLKLNGYLHTFDNRFIKCIVVPISSDPVLLNNDYEYFTDGKILGTDNTELTVLYTGVPNLGSHCFDKNARYVLQYWMAMNEKKDNVTMETVTSIASPPCLGEQCSYRFNINDLEPAVYRYRVVAIDVLGTERYSKTATVQKCLAEQEVVPPTPDQPQDNSHGSTVEGLVFKWTGIDDKIAALRCGPTENIRLILELEEEASYDPAVGPQLSVYSAPLSTRQIVLKNVLLKLSTAYYWRLTIYRERGGEHMIERYSSRVSRFTTVPKHCAYTNCNSGTCEPETVTCACYSGYRGKFCDQSGLGAPAIAGIAVGVAVVLIVVLAATFRYMYTKYFGGLKVPDLSKFMFGYPKRVNEDGDEAAAVELVNTIIQSDPEGNFTKSIKLLECTPVTELDAVCRSLMYAFERSGKSLNFLLKLITYEVEHSESTTTLFRNNSYASKCFKYYGRMVGLSYLFRVIFPLISKVYKEEKQERTVEVYNSDGFKSTMHATTPTLDYELNLDGDDQEDSEYDSAIEENALLIQIACETFFNSLSKANRHCPNEFKVIAKALQLKVAQKYPDHPIELCIASFIFLRFFVAGITVPESFGIIKKRPSPVMRRRLILISKVLSNMSTGVKFGDKEDYMVVMNDYLESKQPQLEKYYSFLTSAQNGHISKPIAVPDAYYEAAIEVLSFAFQKQSTGEWDKELEEQENVFGVKPTRFGTAQNWNKR